MAQVSELPIVRWLRVERKQLAARSKRETAAWLLEHNRLQIERHLRKIAKHRLAIAALFVEGDELRADILQPEGREGGEVNG